MKYSAIKLKCEKLRKLGHDEECRELLLHYGYFETLDPRVQDLFTSCFLPSAILEKELSGSLKDLISKNAANRLEAAKYLSSRARGNWTLDNKNWLADPRTIDVLIAALDDTDTKVLRFVVNSLGNVSQRYNYPDLRIKNAMLPLFEDSGDDIRLEIVQAIPQFATDDRVCEVICDGLNCRPAKKAGWTVGLAVARYAGALMTLQNKERLLSVLLPACSHQKSADSLSVMLDAVVAINLPGTLEELQCLSGSLPSGTLTECVKEAIEELTELADEDV